MRSRVDLDEKGQKLLALLQANAREPTSSLARKVGLSRSAAQERLTRMEQDGTIVGYTVRLGRQPEAEIAAYLLVKLRGAPPSRIVPLLAQYPEIRQCQSISGDVDIVATVKTRTVSELDSLRERVLGIQSVHSVKASVVMHDHFER